MSDQSGPGGPSGPGAPGRKRPGPTIDLKATEVASEPVGSEESAKPSPHQSAGTETPQQDASAAGAAGAAASAPDRRGSDGGVGPWRVMAIAAAGAVLVGWVILAVWSFTATEDSIASDEARIAHLEQQVRELADRPAQPTVDPTAIAELTSRVSALEAVVREQRPAAADPALINRVSALEAQTKALDEMVGGLAQRTNEIDAAGRETRQRADGTATALDQLGEKLGQLTAAQTSAPAEIDALANRITALERSTAAMTADLGKERSGEAADHAARFSVAAAALNAAIEHGDPFPDEMAALRALGADSKALAALEPFAASGAPSQASLCGELLALIPALGKSGAKTERQGGVLARLASGAESLVRIRPVGEVKSDDPAAILSRIELRARQADVEGAIAELAKLPEDVRAPAQSWTEKARARAAAIDASHQLGAEALAALAKSPEGR
jgi:hypothetical protein